MRDPLRRALCALALGVPGVACDSGLLGPGDMGTVRVLVRDEQAVPVRGAVVCVQMPNGQGGLFTVSTATRADGTTSMSAPTGRRRVEVVPPAGYAAGPDPLARFVDVVRRQTVQVDVALRRTADATPSQAQPPRGCAPIPPLPMSAALPTSGTH